MTLYKIDAIESSGGKEIFYAVAENPSDAADRVLSKWCTWYQSTLEISSITTIAVDEQYTSFGYLV